MSIFDISGQDRIAIREQLNEAFSLFGSKCKLYEVLTEDESISRDEIITHKEPKDIHILFENQPQPVLSRLGWNIEAQEEQLVAHIIPTEVNTPVDIRRGALIELDYNLGEDGTRTLHIANVKADSLQNIYYIVLLSKQRISVPSNQTTEINVTGNTLLTGMNT